MKQTNAAILPLAIAIFFNSPAAYAGIFDGDQRRSIVDNNDPRIDALSDAVGAASVCNGTFSAVLIKRNGDPADHVVLPAHGFFTRRGEPVLSKGGKPCSIEEMTQAIFYPNLKYLYLRQDRKFAMRTVRISWPPINLDAGRKWGITGEDVLIFRIDKPAKGYLSDDLMPSGRKRGHVKYFRYDRRSVYLNRFGRLARIAFAQDSPRPLEQLYQITDIRAEFKNGIIFDTSDAWFISSGSPLLGDLNGETAILGHLSIGPGSENKKLFNSSAGFATWNRNPPGTTLAEKYGLVAIPVE